VITATSVARRTCSTCSTAHAPGGAPANSAFPRCETSYSLALKTSRHTWTSPRPHVIPGPLQDLTSYLDLSYGCVAGTDKLRDTLCSEESQPLCVFFYISLENVRIFTEFSHNVYDKLDIPSTSKLNIHCS